MEKNFLLYSSDYTSDDSIYTHESPSIVIAFFHCANILMKHFPVPYLNNKDVQESCLDAYRKNIYTLAHIAYRFFGIRSACVQPAGKSFLSYKVLVLSISQIFVLIEMLVIQMPFYRSLTKSYCSFRLIG